MSLNWKEINLALSEMDLDGAFIQQIVQPGYDSLSLHTYKPGRAQTVLICLGAGVCRIHETKRAIPKNDKPLRFMEFLRSKIRGSRIVSALQLGQERIVQLILERSCADETGEGQERQRLYMYIRLWSGAANILVTDEQGLILDSFYRRPGRGEVSGGHFEPPQPASEVQSDAAQREVRDYDAEAESFCVFIDRWYGDHAAHLSREALIAQAERQYTARRTRMEAGLARLEDKRKSFLGAERWKHSGDLILSFGHLIDGSSDELICEDYETGHQVSIKIDPKKTVQENASAYYTSYKKAVSGLSELEEDMARARAELRSLDALYETFQKEPNPFKLQQLLRKEFKPRQQEKRRPGLTYDFKGWTILVGRTAGENDELLRRHVRAQDMWLHTRDWAGGYVFIKHSPGKTIPLDILIAAGNLAVHHSKARRAGTADLYYTQVKYLRRAKNGPKGLVLPTNEKNLCVRCDPALIRQIEDTLKP